MARTGPKTYTDAEGVLRSEMIGPTTMAIPGYERVELRAFVCDAQRRAAGGAGYPVHILHGVFELHTPDGVIHSRRALVPPAIESDIATVLLLGPVSCTVVFDLVLHKQWFSRAPVQVDIAPFLKP